MSEIQLPSKLTSIATRINSHKNNIGYSFIEIGKELIKAKKEEIQHGEWKLFLDEINMSQSQADRHIKISKEYELGKLPHVGNIGFRALYEIATLPPEEREKEHVTSKGETKTVDEMTVRELQEVKKKLKLAERQAEQARTSEQQAIRKLEEMEDREPERIEVIKEVVPEKVKNENSQLQKEVELNNERLRMIEKENKRLQKELSSTELSKREYTNMKRSIEQLSEKRSDLQQDVEDITEIMKYIVQIDELRKEQMSPITYANAINRQIGNRHLIERLNESVTLVEKWCADIRKVMDVSGQIIEMEEYQ